MLRPKPLEFNYTYYLSWAVAEPIANTTYKVSAKEPRNSHFNFL